MVPATALKCSKLVLFPPLWSFIAIYQLDAFLWAALLSFFNLGAWGVLYTMTPELYPTSIRASGAGAAAAVGRIGGIGAPFVTPLLVGPLGQSGVFALFTGLIIATALVVLVLAEETRGRSLEEIAESRAA